MGYLKLETLEKQIEQLETLEKQIEQGEYDAFTDRIDASIDISLIEYGVIRNPETNETIFYQEYDQTIRKRSITIDDVITALNEAEPGFFDFIGTTKDDCITDIQTYKHIAYYIFSLNQYNGYFE